MPIINLTDLTIRLASDDDEVYQTFEPSEEHTLTLHTQGDTHDVDGVPVNVTVVTGIEGLPDPEEGTYLIVPQPIAYVLNRTDLVMPDTGPSAIRDEDSKVYAVRRLYSVTRDGS